MLIIPFSIQKEILNYLFTPEQKEYSTYLIAFSNWMYDYCLVSKDWFNYIASRIQWADCSIMPPEQITEILKYPPDSKERQYSLFKSITFLFFFDENLTLEILSEQETQQPQQTIYWIKGLTMSLHDSNMKQLADIVGHPKFQHIESLTIIEHDTPSYDLESVQELANAIDKLESIRSIFFSVETEPFALTPIWDSIVRKANGLKSLYIAQNRSFSLNLQQIIQIFSSTTLKRLNLATMFSNTQWNSPSEIQSSVEFQEICQLIRTHQTLRGIDILNLGDFQDENVLQYACEQIMEAILDNHSIEKLLFYSKVTDNFFKGIIQRRNETLRVLRVLISSLDDLKQFIEMIHSSPPALVKFYISLPLYYGGHEPEEKELLESQLELALSENTTIKHLELNHSDDWLQSVLMGIAFNRSIEKFVIDRDFTEELLRLIQQNSSLVYFNNQRITDLV